LCPIQTHSLSVYLSALFLFFVARGNKEYHRESSTHVVGEAVAGGAAAGASCLTAP
jgi:hypothetical protein